MGSRQGCPSFIHQTAGGHSLQQCSGRLGRQCSQQVLAVESAVLQEFPLLGCGILEVGKQSRGESLSFLIWEVSGLKHIFSPG